MSRADQATIRFLPRCSINCRQAFKAERVTPAVPSPGWRLSPHNQNPSRGVRVESPKGPKRAGCCPRPPTIPSGRPVQPAKPRGLPALDAASRSPESKPAVQFPLNLQQPLLLALLVGLFRQLAPVRGRSEHAGDQRGLPGGGPSIPLTTDGDEQRAWRVTSALQVARAILRQCMSLNDAIKHQCATGLRQAGKTVSVTEWKTPGPAVLAASAAGGCRSHQ